MVRLRDHDVWRSARETLPEHRAVVVELSAGGVSGWGEASAFMVGTYASDTSTVLRALHAVAPLLDRLDPADPTGNWALLRPELAHCRFALAALDVAGHDLAARLLDRPLYEHLGLPDPTGTASSYSIGLADPNTMVRKLARAPGWKQYKIKLSGVGDLDVLRALRARTTAPFWLDGNACLRPEDVFPLLDELPGLDVTALEQPFPVDAREATGRVRRESPVPVFADESVTTPDQLPVAAELFDGINVKVLKAGGLTPAVAMLHDARELGLSTMLGCLPESSVGASATAHIAAIADHLDLDTVALLATDTGTGVTLDAGGRIEPMRRPGTGFEPDFTSRAWTAGHEHEVPA